MRNAASGWGPVFPRHVLEADHQVLNIEALCRQAPDVSKLYVAACFARGVAFSVTEKPRAPKSGMPDLESSLRSEPSLVLNLVAQKLAPHSLIHHGADNLSTMSRRDSTREHSSHRSLSGSIVS
jgi:hypothetical protein